MRLGQYWTIKQTPQRRERGGGGGGGGRGGAPKEERRECGWVGVFSRREAGGT
eukprot:COSAG05_NODE_12968_length_446_cov_17.083573_2_plen_52_part_01